MKHVHTHRLRSIWPLYYNPCMFFKVYILSSRWWSEGCLVFLNFPSSSRKDSEKIQFGFSHFSFIIKPSSPVFFMCVWVCVYVRVLLPESSTYLWMIFKTLLLFLHTINWDSNGSRYTRRFSPCPRKRFISTSMC